MGFGQRLTHATASSMSLTSHSQKPATSSCGGAKGPSTTSRPGPSNATRLPSDEGFSPSPVIRTPALISSSLNRPIASIIAIVWGVGKNPFSLSAVAFTSTITRIVRLLSSRSLWPQPPRENHHIPLPRAAFFQQAARPHGFPTMHR